MNINVNHDYSVKQGRTERILLLCKNCVMNESDIVTQSEKKLKKNCSKHRLSFRQKEQLSFSIINRFFPLNDIVSETESVLNSLSKEIGCSKKSLVHYVSKNKERFEEIIRIKSTTSELSQGSKEMWMNESNFQKENKYSFIQELSKLDTIVAPNQCPFESIK